MAHLCGSPRIAYQIYRTTQRGSARCPIVFIRGLGMTMADSHNFASALASASLAPVVTFDHFGFGGSSIPQASWGAGTVQGMAEDCLAVADAACLELNLNRFALFGVSMGGYIAMSAALQRQSQQGLPGVSALVVGCSHHGGSDMVPIDAAYIALVRAQEAILDVHSAGWQAAVREVFARNFTPPFVRESPRFESLLAAYTASCRVDTRLGMAYQKEAVAGFYIQGMRSSLPHIQVPTLVVTGDADAIVPFHNSHLLHTAIPQSDLVVLPGDGHMFFEMSPNSTAEHIASFLDRTTTR